MKPIQEIFPLLSNPVRVVVTMHQKPDPDAMGSALGLWHFLRSFGHEATVVSPTNWANFMDWMPGCDQVVDFDREREKGVKKVQEADWIFCLDFNTIPRTRNMTPYIRESKAVKLLIDHHAEPETESFDYGVSNTARSSTCEMVFDFIMDSGFGDRLNTEMAECLYSGIVTDTGSFRFPAASADVHRKVAMLRDKGINHTQIHENIYDNYLENRFRFIGHVLLNRMEIFYEYNTVLIAVSKHDIKRFDIATGDTEGLVNFPLSIQGIKLAALIFDRDEEIKCSFRSKGGFDVNSFARKYFEGGGHHNAAGGRSSDTLDQTVKRFMQAIKENEDLLT